MAKVLCALAWLLMVAQAAPSGNPASHPLQENNAVAPAGAESGDRTAALLGKKVEVTITKEILKKPLPLGLPGAPITPAPLPLLTTPPPLPAHLPHHHLHTTPAPLPPPALLLDNLPIVLDNVTVMDLLQQLLAGNIQNVQAHGKPLVVPPGGKPVAVIFSAAMHVVDIGNLLPGLKPALPPAAAPALPALVPPTPSMLGALLQPLLSLTHAKEPAIAAAAIPAAPNAQPVVVMVPLPASVDGAPPALPADPAAQLDLVIQGLLKAKKDMLLVKQNGLPPPAVVTTPLPPALVLPPAEGLPAAEGLPPALAFPAALPPPAPVTAAPPVAVVPIFKKVKKITIEKQVG